MPRILPYLTKPSIVGKTVMRFFGQYDMIHESNSHHLPSSIQPPGKLYILLGR